MKDYYATLEIPPTASSEAIREQYLFLIQAWHPDKFRTAAQKAKAEEKCKQLNIAYDILKDARKRAEYDRELSGSPTRSGEQQRHRTTPAERPRPPAKEAPRRPPEQPRRQQAKEKQQPTEEERLRSENERREWVEQEWIRVYFDQARRRHSGQPPMRAGGAAQKPIRVLIVDDVAGNRAYIRNLLGSEPDIRVVGEVPNGAEAVRQFEALTPDVTITGINGPNEDEFVATEAICRKHPSSRIIMLSVPSSTSNIRRAAMAGACDYLTRPVRADDLRSAIRLAAET